MRYVLLKHDFSLKAPALFLFFYITIAFSDYTARGFLKNVKTAADHIAYAVEQAQRTMIDRDTLTVFLYRDDYRVIQQYLFASPKTPDILAPKKTQKSAVLESITLQAKQSGSGPSDALMVLSMQFTDGHGNMLPQNLLARVTNCPVGRNPVTVRFQQTDAVRPFAGPLLQQPVNPNGQQSAAGNPLNPWAIKEPAKDSAAAPNAVSLPAAAAPIAPVISDPSTQGAVPPSPKVPLFGGTGGWQVPTGANGAGYFSSAYKPQSGPSSITDFSKVAQPINSTGPGPGQRLFIQPPAAPGFK